MKKFFKIVGALLLLLVIAFFAVPAVLPAHTHIERSIVIERPPETVFAVVTDFNQSKHWDPWVNQDPNLKATISGTGLGSTYEWESEDSGKGKMTIVKVDPPKLVDLDAVMVEPMESSFKPGWRLEPTAGGTKLTWTYDQDHTYLTRWGGLICLKMVGDTFEKGLVDLKAYIEK